MKRRWNNGIIIGMFFLVAMLSGCNSNANTSEKPMIAPMIIYSGEQYETGYDDSNLLNKLPKGFQASELVQGVETDTSKEPEKEGYASEQAHQIRGVDKGTIIYANKKVKDYIITEDHGKYVVYSSKPKEDVDYSDFLSGKQMPKLYQETMAQEREEIQVQAVTMKEIRDYEEQGNELLLHNNGRAIKTDIFEHDHTGDNSIVGISFVQNEGILYETTYISQKELNEQELQSYIEQAQDELLNSGNHTVIRKGDIVKQFCWQFYEAEEEQVMLVSQFVLSQNSTRSSTSDVDSTVWTVQAASQLKKIFASHINTQTVAIYADYNSQYVLEYGQVDGLEQKRYENNQIDYEIVRYPKEQDGFYTENQSSLSEHYIKWKFMRRLREDEQLNTNPAFKIANTKGNLELSFQYTLEVTKHDTTIFDSDLQYDTGKIKISVPDR